jgi:CHAT domain-containing protein
MSSSSATTIKQLAYPTLLFLWLWMMLSCFSCNPHEQDRLAKFSYLIKDYVHQPKTNTKFAQADSLKYARNYPLSKEAFLQLFKSSHLSKPERIYALNQAAFTCLKMDEDGQATILLQELEKLQVDFSPLQKADYLFNRGVLYLHLIQPSSAKKALLEAEMLYLAHYPNQHLRIALTRTALALYHYDFSPQSIDFEKAANTAFLCFYTNSEDKPSVLHPFAAEAHFLMAHWYRSINRDYRAGLNHCEVAEELTRIAPWRDTKLLARCLGVKGLLYKKDALFHVADSVINVGLKLLLETQPENVLVQEVYRFLMINAAGRTDDSLGLNFTRYLTRLKKHLERYKQTETYVQTDELKAYFYAHAHHANQDSCLAACLRAREKIHPYLPSFRYYQEEILNFLAQVNVSKENYDLALDHQLESFKTKISEPSINKINTWQDALVMNANQLPANLFFFHFQAGSILLKKYKSLGDETLRTRQEVLEQAIAHFTLADSLMSLRLTMSEEGVFAYYQEMKDEAYFNPLEAIYELHQLNNKPHQAQLIYNLAFRFIERQKSFLLYREDILQGREDIVERLKAIKKSAKRLNELKMDSSNQAFLSKTLASYEYQQALSKLAAEARWKFNQRIESVQQIQKDLSESEFLVQYKAIRNDYFLVLALGKDQIIFEKINAFAQIQDSIAKFKKYILAPKDTQGLYFPLAQQLYQKLLGPLAKILPPKNAELVIIPDAALNNLPFEALVCQNLDRSKPTDFLVNAHFIAYAPSWKVWNHNRKEPLFKTGHRAAFFTYNQSSPYNLDEWDTEWAAVKALFCRRAHLYDREDCSKQRLFKIAYRYKVLHFSLHGQSNPNLLRENKLYFKLADSLISDPLNGIELSDQNLKGKLVVLSACETNAGQVTPEGTYSLSRAFLQAGSACTVSTLWRVNEQSTALVIERFYFHLRRHSPWVALGKAKRDYLHSPQVIKDRKQSFYWAGLVATI